MKKVSFNAAKVIMHMSEKELKHYSIDLTPLDGMTDHELLVNLAKKVDCDHEILLELVKEFKEFKGYVIDQFSKHGWIK